MFEALFDRRLEPTGSFAADLKAAGYDPATATQKYPTEVWTRCLEIARSHRWPALSRAEAYRQIGREFTLGFMETIPGRLVSVALPFMSLDSFLKRLQSYFRMGREDTGLTFDIVERAKGLNRVEVHNPAEVPGTFVAGLIEIAIERMRVTASVEVLQKTPAHYELLVRWA